MQCLREFLYHHLRRENSHRGCAGGIMARERKMDEGEGMYKGHISVFLLVGILHL